MSVNPQVRRGAAFKLACIGKSSSRRFECCATYQNYVFIGTSTGVDFSAVRMSQIVEGEWELASISTIAAANNKPVTQIAVVPELKILLLLSDGKLFIHTFDPTMDMSRPQAMLSPNPSGTVNLRDCVTFALKKHEGTYTLAVALKTKRIAVCVWRLGTFDMSKDLQSPEIPKSMLWLGKRLMLCFSASVKEYCAVEIDTGKVTTLLEAKQTALACYINGFRENLVVSDTIGLRLSESGGTNKKVIRWSLPPKSMIYVHPYLLSLHNAVIEVHFPHIQGKTFCQPLALKNLESFSSVSYIDYDAPSPTVLQPSTTVVKRDAVIALSGDGSMHLLVAYPIKDQVTSLAKERQFEEANDLANLCPNEVSDALKLRLTLLHANHLFEMGNYSDVVAKLTAAKIDPRFMINFFPEYMPEVVRRRWTPPDDTIVQYKSTSFSREATTLVIAYLESWRAGRPNATEHRPPIKEASLENASDVMCAMAAVDTALMHALCDVDQDPGKLIRAPNYIVLEEARKKFLKGSHDYTSFGLLYLALRDWKEMDATLTLLHRIAVLGSDDFSAHLASPDIKGTPLNALMRQLVEAGGVDAGRYYEAAEARRVVDRNMPTLKKEEKDVLVRQFMAVTITAYILKELDGEQPEQEALVLQHSSWLLSSFPPIYATSIFVKDSKKIQPKKVAEFLEPFPSTCNEYLARLMGPDVNSVTDDELHKYRVTALMRLLSDSSLQLAVKAQYTTELTEFLNKSTRYNLQDALRQLEAMPRETNDNLVRAQTIIYRKLGMHQQAVALLLNTNRPRDAENYAREVSDESRRTGKTADAFQYLVKAMLDRTDGTPAQREAEVLSLIGRNPQMDAVAALEVLPDKTKVTDLKTFLINALRASDAQARSQMIKANMLKSTHRSLDVVAAITKSASVRLTRDSKCEVCSRAIGASIFLRFPDGALAHHGCVQDKNVSPDTGRDFTRNVDLL